MHFAPKKKSKTFEYNIFLLNYEYIREKVQKDKKDLVADIDSSGNKETELVKGLQEKYGTGNIDPETGEITPIQ